MSIQRISVGPRMSKAVVHGNTVYLAGQVADKAAGKSVGEQTADILGIIDGLLAEAGTDATVLLCDVDLQRSEHVRRIWPFLRDRRIDAYGDLTKRYRD